MSESTTANIKLFKQPSGSTPLWAHLLRRDISTLPPDPGITITPTAPLDKNGTSMRLLLHDTQANFEKFSERVDKLTTGVDDAKAEIVLVKKLFQQEHEQLAKDIVDLVDRSQTQVQRSVGEPAQALKVEDLRKDIQSADRQLECLDKRLDALHALTQTQTRTLQMQSQALQTLQDQQGTIITALMPLLPLLQAIPLHFESARVNLKELLQTQMHTNPPVIAPSDQSQAGKRSSSTLHSDRPLSSPTEILAGHKRPRLESESVPTVRPQEPQSSPILPSLSSQIQSRSYHAPMNRRQTTQVGRLQSNRFRSPLSAPLTHGKDSLDATPQVQQQTPQVPRIPLSDLPTPTDNARPNETLANSVTAQNLMQPSLIYNPTSLTLLPAFTSPKQRPSRTLRTLSSASSRPPPSPAATKLYNRFTSKKPDRPTHVDDIFSSNTPRVRQDDPKPKPSESVTPVSAKFRNSPSFQTSLPEKTAGRRPPFTPGNNTDRSRSSVRPSGEAPVPRDNDENASAIGSSLLVPSEVAAPRGKPLSIKDRRASFRSTHKRFIPLDDDDDDEE